MVRKLGFAIVGLVTLVGMSAESGAQGPPSVRSLAPGGRREQSRPEIPAGQMPPPGMCRVWIDNVPAGQQPAPTDCHTAIRNKPQNGRVIFSDEEGRDKRGTKGESGREKRDGKEPKPKKPDPSR